MRKFCTVITALGVVLAAPACAPSTKSGGDKVTLTVLSWRPEDTAGYAKIFAPFEKSHPKIKVKFKPIKNTEYLTVLPTELKKATGGPDVVQLKPYGPIQSLISIGNLAPLDGQVDVSKWDPTVLQAAKGKQDGKLYGVPYAMQTLSVLYNKKIFADQQIQPPTTWAQFIADCDKLKKAGITPLSTSGLQPWVLAIDHQIFGATRYGGDDFAKAAMSGQKNFTDPDYVASLDVTAKLKPYYPDKVTAVDYPDAQTLFTSGKAAMYPGGSYEVGPFTKTNPDLQIGSFDAPCGPGRQGEPRADLRLRRRLLRRERALGAQDRGDGTDQVDGDAGVRPAVRQHAQADLGRPRRDPRRPAARADVPGLQDPRRDVHDGRRLRLREPARP